MPEELKRILSNKWIRLLLILPFLALVVLITWPLPAILIGDPILQVFAFY